MFLLELEQKKLGALKLETIKRKFILFDSKEECEEWLSKNGFVYGQELCYKYVEGKNYWFHQNNTDFLKAYAYIREQTIKGKDTEAPAWIFEMMYS